jgi:hypothetical protein
VAPGPNPTTASYNASVVNFNNAMISLVRFESKSIFFYFKKRSSLLQRWLWNMVARWFVFEPKITIWEKFVGSQIGKCGFDIFYCHLEYFMDMWDIL